ncbi:hypothetical protein GF360_00660 [candidate division WWE3 bacterium]|nr:hypothetical protein [candidate division WWE3 bacterium]
MNNRGIKRYLPALMVAFVVSLSSISFFTPSAEAAVGDVFRGANHLWHMAVDREYRENNILKTAIGAGSGLLIDMTSLGTTGKNPDTLTNCAMVAKDLDKSGNLLGAGTGCDLIPNTCESIQLNSSTPEEDTQVAIDAAEMVKTYDPKACALNETAFSIGTSADISGSGSLLGMVLNLEHTVHREEIPVNMAYFFKDYAQRIPVVRNTAYAQSTPDNYLGAKLVFAMWKLTRNIALGLMSIFLLVVGVMIMTRKKINPQAVVTVQNSLPRIALSIALIFFSYPIGTLLVRLTGPLMGLAVVLPVELVADTAVDTWASTEILNDLSSSGAFSYIGWGVLASVNGLLWNAGMGLTLLFSMLVFLIVLLVVALIAFIKVLVTYIKLLSYIVISPIYFALGVIPGKEDMILNWFKEIAAGVLSIFAMVLVLALTFAFPFIAFLSQAQGGMTDLLLQSGLTAVFTPIIMIFTCITSVKMPKKVSAWIKGDPKKR